MSSRELAEKIMARSEALGRISDEPGRLTRTYGSPAMLRANELTGQWMRDAGLTVTTDAVGNLIGRLPGPEERAKTFLLGSHLDTVRDAGKYDGPLGVLIAIACVEKLRAEKVHLPFAVEVIGFADEEGVRFHTTYLGSKALAGKLTEADLRRFDSRGVTLAEAMENFGGRPGDLKSARRDPQQLLGYAEAHIEQGPVLEKKYQPVGVVSGIAGQTRIRAIFTGQAGHAGTTPMNLRRDSLAAAAQFIGAVETSAKECVGLVATVGQIEASPGASNVIPGKTTLTVDVRHQADQTREAACARLQGLAQQIGDKRGITVDWEVVHEAQSVPCSRELTNLLAKAARGHLVDVPELPSGAGHDAAIMGEITPVAMLFIRCKDGISHHPAESVMTEDVALAIAVMSDFLALLANDKNPFAGKRAA